MFKNEKEIERLLGAVQVKGGRCSTKSPPDDLEGCSGRKHGRSADVSLIFFFVDSHNITS